MERPLPENPHDDWWWIFDPRLSLRARAALVVGGSLVVLTLLLSWLGGRIVERQTSQHFALTFESLAFQIGDRLDRQFYERMVQLQFTANLAPFRTPEASVAERRAALEIAMRSSLDLAWLGFADASGNIVCATNGLFEGTKAAELPWFLLGRNKPHIGPAHAVPELARLALEPSEQPVRYLDFAVPAQTPQGRFLGVICAQVRVPPLADAQLSLNAEAARREHLGVTIYGPTGDVLLDTGATGWTDPPGAPSVRDLRGSQVETVGGGSTYFTGYFATRGYRDSPSVGWLVAVRQPVKDAFAPARRVQRDIAAWGFALTVALATLTWWFTSRLVRQMAKVENAARLIRQGDPLTVLPHPEGEGEMERMCHALGDLVEDLRAKTPKPTEQPPASETRPW
jgi:hypothetical protein